MKIDLRPVLEQLTRLQHQMGVTVEPELPAALRDDLFNKGIETTIHDIPLNPEGLITWRGQVVVLYIRDQYSWGSTGYRFHVAECGTVETMRAQGRGSRYVVSNRTDGSFPIRASHRGETTLLTMIVCKNCLHRLDWDGYRRATHAHRIQIVAEFDIAAFFETYKTTRSPTKWAKPEAEAPVKHAPSRTSTQPPPARPSTATVPETAPVSSATHEAWTHKIEDAQFRQAALQVQRFGSLSEKELHEMVGGARRARRFDLSIDEWFREAPFRLQVRSVKGTKLYVKVQR